MANFLGFTMGVSLLIFFSIGISITIKAFEKDISWGFTCFLAGIGTIAFMIEHWNDHKVLFCIYIASFISLILSAGVLILR